MLLDMQTILREKSRKCKLMFCPLMSVFLPKQMHSTGEYTFPILGSFRKEITLKPRD